jgi:hypothetical protein
VKYDCKCTVADFIRDLYVAIDTLPTKSDLFAKLFSFMGNITEKRVDFCHIVLFDELIMSPLQDCIAVLVALSIALFKK